MAPFFPPEAPSQSPALSAHELPGPPAKEEPAHLHSQALASSQKRTVSRVEFTGLAMRQEPQPSAISHAQGLSLEESVREMLRPMLMDWLNQHMPRILENAIREEISARGLPFKRDDR
jgi:hypothetical protein